MRLDQTYDPVEVESTWYDFWMQHGLFHADEHSDRPAYTIVIPPPNVTGSLHMGHALFVTLQDVLIRFKRMQGFEALWLPGTDHAGIATQVVVERLLRKEGTTRHELGREAFLQRVWQWKAESGGRIVEQLKRLGASCDWERERFTMDEGLSHAVREIFVRMYEDDLIYRGERMVDWDPVTQTVLSGLEVLTDPDGERGKFWTFRYPLEDGSGHISISTTRPETMLGDSAVAVHPDDPRYKALIGKQLRLPLVGRLIPIIADGELAKMDKGTGAVKVTPAHDPNDYACGLRHDLPRHQVIGLDATMTADCPPEFAGLDRYEARDKIVAALDALGLLEKVEEITYSPGRSERSGVIVEPLVMQQWFVRGERLAKPAIEAVESGRTRIIPAMWKKTYDHFMYNIQEWCISRQLWWGHQIPAWHGPDGEIFVARTEQEAHDKATAHYGAPTALMQDPDVLDTWFSSGLWPFSTLGWPEQTPSLAKFYPTSVLETGSDILFFWVARMMMMGIYIMGEVPFKDVYLHSIVRDEKGKKMSKTKGNVIDPLHLIYGVQADALDPEAHRELLRKIEREQLTLKREGEELPGLATQGADALRFTLAVLASQGRDVNLDISRMEGYRAFLNKLWNASRFALMNLADAPTPPHYTAWTGEGEGAPLPMNPAHMTPADRWIVARLNVAVAQATQALDQYLFNDYAQALYHFVWHELCDWYIELAKPTLYADAPEHADARRATQATISYVIDVTLRLMHPIAPYITEDIWQAMPKGEGAPVSVMRAAWPVPREGLADATDAAAVDLAIALIGAIRNIRGETGVKPGVVIPTLSLVVPDEDTARRIDAARVYLCRLAKIDQLEVVQAADAVAQEGVATAVVEGVEVRIPLKGLINVEEEQARLTRELGRVADDIAFVNRKLDNPKFVERAPAEILQKERDKLAALQQEQAALEASMADLAKLA